MNSPEPRSSANETVSLDVVVIGAGQAGLAIGYLLARVGLVRDPRSRAVGSAWRGRWESLTLFTPRRYSALPAAVPRRSRGVPDARRGDRLPRAVRETFELPLELGSEVERLRAAEGQFQVEVDGRTIAADHVVVATGPFQTPFVPELAGGLADDVYSSHSTGYRRPSDLPSGTVLVVGGGNTGFQIAKELASSREVHLAVGSRQKPLPQRFLGRDLFWWLTATRLLRTTVESRLGRKLRAGRRSSAPARDSSGVAPTSRCGRAPWRRPGARWSSRTAASSRSTPSSGQPATAPTTRGSRPGLRRRRPSQSSPRCHGRLRPLFPRPHVAAHAGLGADRLGEGRRGVHRGPDRGSRLQAVRRTRHARKPPRNGQRTASRSRRKAFSRRRGPSWSSSPTATPSTSRSPRSPSASATTRCACSRTTARCPARR